MQDYNAWADQFRKSYFSGQIHTILIQRILLYVKTELIPLRDFPKARALKNPKLPGNQKMIKKCLPTKTKDKEQRKTTSAQLMLRNGLSLAIK